MVAYRRLFPLGVRSDLQWSPLIIGGETTAVDWDKLAEEWIRLVINDEVTAAPRLEYATIFLFLTSQLLVIKSWFWSICKKTSWRLVAQTYLKIQEKIGLTQVQN